MPSWCRQVNWGNCGIKWMNCAVLCMKDDWKGQVKTVQFTQFFLSGMKSHSKFAQFNWEGIGRFTNISFVVCRKIKWRPTDTYASITNKIRNFEWWQTIKVLMGCELQTWRRYLINLSHYWHKLKFIPSSSLCLNPLTAAQSHTKYPPSCGPQTSLYFRIFQHKYPCWATLKQTTTSHTSPFTSRFSKSPLPSG